MEEVDEFEKKVKDKLFLQKRLETNAEKHEDTKEAYKLAMADTILLFTAMTKVAEKLIDKNLKEEEVPAELVEVYKAYKF